MSGDWITVRGGDGKLKRVIDAPDTCPQGHATVVAQMGTCPQCYAMTATFWCDTAGCAWRVAGASHYERECSPGSRNDPNATGLWHQRG